MDIGGAGGVALGALLEQCGETLKSLREKVEKDVRYANITIIEGHGASQYGIGIVSARIAEMILRDERAIVPIGSYQKGFGVTLSLPSVVGRGGVTAILPPQLSDGQRLALEKSADNLKTALTQVKQRR
jgi:L-lactate dehydrogenase